MGNRAIITSTNNIAAFKKNRGGIGIYVHWNGGLESVRAFVEYARLRGVRNADSDESYCFARLTQIISNFFGGNLSIGIDSLNYLGIDQDNGCWVFNKDFKIYKNIEEKWERDEKGDWKSIGFTDHRIRNMTKAQKQELIDFLVQIDKAQPLTSQLGEDYIKAEEVKPSEFKAGDFFFEPVGDSWKYNFETHEEIARPSIRIIDGIETDALKIEGGKRVFGIPYYTNEYGHKIYMMGDTYRRATKEQYDEQNKEEKEEKKETPVYTHAVTFVYSDGNNSAYLHTSLENAKEEVDQVINDLVNGINEESNKNYLPIQIRVRKSNADTTWSLESRDPTQTHYQPVVVATISQLYK